MTLTNIYIEYEIDDNINSFGEIDPIVLYVTDKMINEINTLIDEDINPRSISTLLSIPMLFIYDVIDGMTNGVNTLIDEDINPRSISILL